MADNNFPGLVPNKAKDDDRNSVIYASTDDGWTHDDESNHGNPEDTVSPVYSRSDSPNLIDFSDFTDGTLQKGSSESSIRTIHQSSTHQEEPDQDNKLVLNLDAYPQAQGRLDPESPPFTPSKRSSVQSHPSSSTHSSSSYADARQSLDSRDDHIATLTARVKELEHGHETLKRANDDLDTINEKLKHDAEQAASTIETLEYEVSQANKLKALSEKTATETNEENERLQTTLEQLREDFDESESQLLEYKKKLAGVRESVQPLEERFQESQLSLINAVERIKMIETFARKHLAEHPEDVDVFAAVGLSPHDSTHQHDSLGQKEVDSLISFDEPPAAPTISSHLHLPEPHRNDLMSVSAQAQAEETVAISNNDGSDDRLFTQDIKHQPVGPQKQLDGLNWSPGSDQMWESDIQRVQAIRNHQGARPTGRIPGMLIHGLRFVRQRSEQKLTADDDIPDVDSRQVIMSGLPDGIHIQRVLEHVRGGRVLKAHIVTMGAGENKSNMAHIEFAKAEDAMAFYRFTRCREFGFTVDNQSLRARTKLPDTDSFPLNEVLQTQLGEGYTRCLSVADFPVMHLQVILEFAGMSRNFADIITHFACSDDGSFEITFSDIRSAVLVRDCILRSKSYGGPRDGSGVAFRPDPCDAPLEELQVPFLPIEATSDLSILHPDNARLFMTEEERQLDGDRLLEEVVAAADPEDPDTFQEHHIRKNIVWEKGANWDEIPVYIAYCQEQRANVPHQRDPASGAVRKQYHGNFVITPDEHRKEWLFYNQDSDHPWTQKTADIIYAATGEIDIRKIVVDDGGLTGDAEQSMKNQTADDEGSPDLVAVNQSMVAKPPLTEVARGYMQFNDPSSHVPVSVYVNNVNSGMSVPSLLDEDIQPTTTPATPTAIVPPHLRGRNQGSHTSLSSPAHSVTNEEIGGSIYGISKPSFNKLTARIAKDRNQAASKKAHAVVQPPFW